jgi:hypothetical protein
MIEQQLFPGLVGFAASEGYNILEDLGFFKDAVGL